MKNTGYIISVFSAILILLLTVSCRKEAPNQTASASPWPRSVPCRIDDTASPDLFLMTLGEVETPLAQGVFDPLTDTVRLREGTTKNDYFKNTLGVKYFAPIDKSIFPLPPSGFCTWYYYYQDINEDEVKANARWIAENLKDYGAEYVQVDDGWQGETAEGRHGSRDWTTVDKAFPGGMAPLAAAIKSLGLKPGIWLAPHGQSNETVVKNSPGVFLFKPDGTSASETWEGKYLVDPSAPEAHAYLKGLFTKLSGWGYEYFKIDGQPIVVDEYKRTADFMKNPAAPEELYRKTVASIRQAIGPESYLLGCWGIPLEGVGLMNGSRTGGDIVLGWRGFLVSLQATMRWYFTHNIAWYADPDVVLVRPPLTLDQARVWATLQGLTGQALLSSDRLMDLSEERVELLRRIYPAVDIRPLDLFPSVRNKRIWDLKINHLGRRYDVIGVFNFGENRAEQIRLSWKELGIASDRPVHVFDFWNGEYLGAWESGMAVKLAPTSCRVLTLLESTDSIQLISTSRHITQGWVDLMSLNRAGDGLSFTGQSRLVKNDPYELQFVFPRGKNFRVKQAEARSGSGKPEVDITNHQGWATVRISPSKTTATSWKAVFEPADSYRYATREPGNLRVERTGLDSADFQWAPQYYLNVGYQVYLDGELLGYTPETIFPLSGLDPRRTYTAEVRAVWEDGSSGPAHKKAELKFSLFSMLPDEVKLTELQPAKGAGRIPPWTQATLSGKRLADVIAPGSDGAAEYNLFGLFKTFSADVGIADQSPVEGEAEFVLAGDGKVLWRSGMMKKNDRPKPVRISIKGVNRLVLKVEASVEAGRTGSRRFGPLAVWAEAKVSGLADNK